MRSSISRRQLLALGAGFIGGAALSHAISDSDLLRDSIHRFEVPLPVPPVLTPIRTDGHTDYYDIVQREARVDIVPGRQTTIWGYNGLFPGPTIKARRGRGVAIRHTNQLSTPTVVHLHGGVTPADSDGFPTDCVMPGQSRTYWYPNTQRAATLWYHDHAMDQTGRNIYMGLAGLYLVEDEEEDAARLPDGPHDVPLLIQDRLFGSDGSLLYRMLDHLAAQGGTLLVNGAPWPYLDVSARTYRFRVVNGSNATPLRLALSSGQPLILIATDGGLLPAPIQSPDIPLAMAERVEVLIDFSAYSVGTTVVLRNLNTAGTFGAIATEIMQFRVVRQERYARAWPTRLSEFQPIQQAAPARSRHFVLSARPSWGVLPIPSWRINGKRFDPEQPIASPRYGDVEIWRFT